MGYLSGLTLYLAGPIDNFEGEDWRTKYYKNFKDLGLKTYSPMLKPSWISPDARVKKLSDKTVKNMSNCTYCGSYVSSKEVRSVCLSMLSHSDIILCYLPKIFTVGTIDELFKSDEWFKPIIFVFEKESIVSLYGAELFSRHITTKCFDDAIKVLKSINTKGINSMFINSGLDSYCRWLPITHKAS